jgi:hypothetical protein|tara:strand:- start:14836 stop:15039 length:204 start_codon:yes stop_codon:yes gene_type:complete
MVGEIVNIDEKINTDKKPNSFLNNNGKKIIRIPNITKGNRKIKSESPKVQKKLERILNKNIPWVNGL